MAFFIVFILVFLFSVDKYSESSIKRVSGTEINFLQHRAAKAQQARKIYTSSALEYNVSVLFGIDYSFETNRASSCLNIQAIYLIGCF